jgi:hypothetical protein
MSKKQKNNHKRRASMASSRKVARREPNPWHLRFVFVCVALVVAAFLHFSAETFPDPDVFYHFRHAAIYGSPGEIFRTSFPWVRYSVINEFSSDLWYGFHLLLIPFTLVRDPILGMQLAGIFITFVFLLSAYAACACLKIKPALFWPFFLLFSSAFLLHRLAMLRPLVLSLSLSMLLFAFLAIENLPAVFFAALGSTFIHLNFFFVSFVLLAVFTIVKFLKSRLIPWREALVLIGGVLAGWLLRPNPLGAVKILYVQLFQLTVEKIGGSPLDLAAEMSPLALKTTSNYLLFVVLLFLCFVYSLSRYFKKQPALSSRDTTNLMAAAALSTIFFLLAIFFARRAFDFCSVFGVIFVGLVFSHWLYETWWARLVLIIAFIFLVPYGLNLRRQVLSDGWDSIRFKDAAEWIADNSSPGDIVFNARWEYFPELFFWNTKNVYVSGTDPIFQFVYDPKLYKKGYDLVMDNNPSGIAIDPYRVLKEDFKARYVVLAKPFDDSLRFRLDRDAGFVLKQENDRSAVFEIK